jgi:negative regulator of sigma E activity
MDEERNAFEASCAPRTDLAWSKQRGAYSNPVVQKCWVTWQKARASMRGVPHPAQVDAGVEALLRAQASEAGPPGEAVVAVYLAMTAAA